MTYYVSSGMLNATHSLLIVILAFSLVSRITEKVVYQFSWNFGNGEPLGQGTIV